MYFRNQRRFFTFAIGYTPLLMANPIAVDDQLSVDMDKRYQPIDVLANDSGSGTLYIQNIDSLPSHGALSIVGTLGQPGVVLSYSPNEDFYGTDSFSYIMSDGTTVNGTLLALDSADVSIAVELVCNGMAPTITGSMSSEVITGTSGDDVIIALGGDDTIDGQSGNDIICGGSGVDDINGRNGQDTLFGVSGDDVLKGAKGNDTLYGGLGNDRLVGGNDNDAIFGETGNDNLVGGSGDDMMYGGDGQDYLKGAAGLNDLCSGGAGLDRQDSTNTCETVISIP